MVTSKPIPANGQGGRQPMPLALCHSVCQTWLITLHALNMPVHSSLSIKLSPRVPQSTTTKYPGSSRNACQARYVFSAWSIVHTKWVMAPRTQAIDFIKHQFGAGGDDQVVVIQHPAIRQNDLIGVRFDLLDRDRNESDVLFGQVWCQFKGCVLAAAPALTATHGFEGTN